MAIEKQIPPTNGEIKDEELEISILNPEAVGVETEDGGMLIDFTDGEDKDEFAGGFNDNLVELMEEGDLEALGSELISQYQGDKDSRQDWEETYRKGLDQLGLKIEDRTEPWAGACGVFHPLLTESVVRFQSQAISDFSRRRTCKNADIRETYGRKGRTGVSGSGLHELYADGTHGGVPQRDRKAIIQLTPSRIGIQKDILRH